MGKLDPVDIYHNQAAILGWLRGLGHRVSYGPDPQAPPLQPRLGFTPPTIRVLQSHNGRPCPYCGETMQRGTKRYPSRDHVVSRHQGGTFVDPENCLVVCGPCNNNKGNRTLEQFAMLLRYRHDPRLERVERLIAQRAESSAATS